MNRGRLWFGVFVWGLMAAVLLFFAAMFTDLYFLTPPVNKKNIHMWQMFAIGMVIGPLLIFGFYFLLNVFKFLAMLVKNTPAMVIDREGITDHTNPELRGQIPWSDVLNISTRRSYVIIWVNDAGVYTSRLQWLINATFGGDDPEDPGYEDTLKVLGPLSTLPVEETYEILFTFYKASRGRIKNNV
ncbi:hypothetical protein LJB99_04035 [Deltaproteobacteria bacterium OttesenSCG-928-K17]|nr:hypothetical protein [Deltaproteobacteria bacterium OttesenSCG-928-K17]